MKQPLFNAGDCCAEQKMERKAGQGKRDEERSSSDYDDRGRCILWPEQQESQKQGVGSGVVVVVAAAVVVVQIMQFLIQRPRQKCTSDV